MSYKGYQKPDDEGNIDEKTISSCLAVIFAIILFLICPYIIILYIGILIWYCFRDELSSPAAVKARKEAEERRQEDLRVWDEIQALQKKHDPSLNVYTLCCWYCIDFEDTHMKKLNYSSLPEYETYLAAKSVMKKYEKSMGWSYVPDDVKRILYLEGELVKTERQIEQIIKRE